MRPTNKSSNAGAPEADRESVVLRDFIEDFYPLESLYQLTAPVRLPFFEKPAVELAQSLIGSVLLHGATAGTIVETEAYLGLDDLAAHAAKGLTERTKVLFGPPGRAYVYFIYGIHECLNVVAGGEGHAGCVLIRALAPLSGLRQMAARRSWNGPVCGLTNGPGKLTEALHITRAQYGQRMDEGNLVIRRWLDPPAFEIGVTPRIGITKCVDWPLRYVWQGHSCLSKREKRAR
ncbi:MAG TPA: DNA-3-methyladenine glycosylase [Bryobacteraceae bacterium]|nr:DNA-3-methyladenine glycosylase [Bryobacteraceae bacterium]